MNRKLLGQTTSVVVKNTVYLGFAFHIEFEQKFDLLSKGLIDDAQGKKVLEVAQKGNSEDNKKLAICVTARVLILHRTHLPQTSWQSGIRPRSIFSCGRLCILSFKVL